MPNARRRLHRSILYGFVAFFCFFSAAPFGIMAITTFKGDWDLYRSRENPFLFNKYPPPGDDRIIDSPTLEHLDLLFNHTNYLTWVKNSAFVGVLVVIITLIIAIPAAYSLARLAGRWGEGLGMAIFLVYLVPPTLLFIPLYQVVVWLGLANSRWSLVVVYPTISIPFCVWLLMGFFKSIPPELVEAAQVDGYSRVQSFLRVVLPLSYSGVVAVTVFTFTLTLTEFIYALSFISDSTQRTVSVGIPNELVLGDVFYWQSILAAAVIVAVPVGIIYNIFLDRMVSGFTMGAVKG